MKKILLVLFFFTSSLSLLFAQDYLVYTVKGDVVSKDGEKVVKVETGMILGAKTVLVIPAEARLVVFCETSKELSTIKVEATDVLENLVNK